MKINLIYESISGEGGFIKQGTWVTFVRTQGCTLRCSWCDTPQALDHKTTMGVEFMGIEDIADKIKTKHVLLTGGEPLEQVDIELLLRFLATKGHLVQVETSGHMPPVGDKGFASWVVDYKCPSSNMVNRMPTIPQFMQWWSGYQYMVKLVVNPKIDTDFAIQTMQEMTLLGYSEMFLVSPLDGRGDCISELASRIREVNQDLLDRTVFSVQLHKLVSLP